MASFKGFFILRAYQIMHLLAYYKGVIRESFKDSQKTPELAYNELICNRFNH
jgi:hypothetical protein